MADEISLNLMLEYLRYHSAPTDQPEASRFSTSVFPPAAGSRAALCVV